MGYGRPEREQPANAPDAAKGADDPPGGASTVAGGGVGSDHRNDRAARRARPSTPRHGARAGTPRDETDRAGFVRWFVAA